MPPSLIRSLCIEFPRSGKKGKYANVPPIYDEQWFTKGKKKIYEKGMKSGCGGDVPAKNSSVEQNIATSSSKEGPSSSTQQSAKPRTYDDKTSKRTKSLQRTESIQSDDSESDNNDTEAEAEDEEDGAEDWERHEALHDDVPNQNRLKERVYEEDMEVVWEKGGSGLVFYTDSYAWSEMKGKDFDADTTDDWDVDYSVYYEDGKCVGCLKGFVFLKDIFWPNSSSCT